MTLDMVHCYGRFEMRVLLAAALCVLPAAAQAPDGAKLKQAADEVAKLDQVDARARVDDVFRYADWLLGRKDRKVAIRYLQSGLRIHAWRLDQQLKLAKALRDDGDKEAASRPAEIVAARSEDDALVAEARAFLGKPLAESRPAPLEEAFGPAPVLVLIPMEDVDHLLVEETAASLSTKLGIPVQVRRIEFVHQTPGRDPRGELLGRVRSSIKRQSKDAGVKKALQRNRMTIEDLADDEKLIIVARTLAEGPEGIPFLARFDEELRLVAVRRQWDVSAMRKQFVSTVAGARRKGAAFLGVTRKDVYADSHNYLFGQAEGDVGIFSFARYRAEFYEDSPDRRRLLVRMLKQALTSAGHVFGVERCTDPTCARAFSNSLQEHDAKSDEACAACKAGFAKAFGSFR